MTLVNFYTLSAKEDGARLQFACRLTEKARSLGHDVFILTDSPAQAKILDDMLWQFKAISFIPHALADGHTESTEAVIIGPELPDKNNDDVIINLSGRVCEAHQRFARINEILTADDDSLVQGRKHYRYYQAQGYRLETHKL
ncbi:MAG: DNA polymerase III subunit chi [Proteobacteria bacterium]|nr:DNA polymerase III subunit chi [Pseudomonadota bacterium]